MSNNIEIILDLDSLEIYEVIDLSQNEESVEVEDSFVEFAEKDKREVCSSIVWQFVQDEYSYELLLVAKDEYCYSRRSRDGTERQT